MKTHRGRLVIVGACGYAREVAWAASDVPSEARDWEVAGFLADGVDAARAAFAARGIGLPVLGDIVDYQPRAEDRLVIAIPSPRRRLAAARLFRARGAEFASVLHPTALIHPSATVGVALVLRHYSGIGPNATIGDFVIVGSLAGTAHDTVVGDGCTLGTHSDVMGDARLGRGVMMGSHAVVLPGAEVGDFATVGVGSVVLRRVTAGVTVFGVPARRLDFVPTVTLEDDGSL